MSMAVTFTAIVLSIVLGLAVHHSKYTPKKLGTSGFGVTRDRLTVSNLLNK